MKTEKLKIKIIVIVVLYVILVLSLFGSNYFEKIINFSISNFRNEQIDNSGLVFNFIDVGQADCILVEFPNNKKMLIDTGDVESESNAKMLGYLEKNIDFENNVIDYLILTHTDSDHIGGAISIFETFQVNNFYYPDVDLNISKLFKDTMDTFENEPNCTYEHTGINLEFLQVGDVEIDMLSPFYNGATYSDSNNQSCILNFKYKNRSVLLTGDATEELEMEVINQHYNYDFDVDILKVAHHGSEHSSTEEFLNKVKPEISVISVGKNNYRHPGTSTLNKLYQYCSDNVFRTDYDGSVKISISKNSEIAINTVFDKFVFPWYIFIILVYLCGVIFVFKNDIKRKLNLKNNVIL